MAGTSPGDRSSRLTESSPNLGWSARRCRYPLRTRGIHQDRRSRSGTRPGRYFAAGDATAFPVKQGGLAAQQADAVAEAIAASVGADIDPQPFRPVLRGILLTGGPARYLRADISGEAGDDSIISGEPLWWPPNKLSGRYLAPYLNSQTGEASDVMPQDEHAIHVETALEPVAPDNQGIFGELSDSPPR